MKRLFLIDAYALIFRYYYAFYTRPMRNAEGMNTSIVFGFAKFLRDLIKRENPDLLGVAFDPPGGSFRRRLFPEYKANRSATPEDIITSVPYVKQLVEAMCIPILEVADYEADDVIGTLSAKGEAAGYEVFMVTPDKDYGQLVTDNCKLYRTKDNEVQIVDREAIKEKYGIDDPQLVRDILALWGDASDNIPGVPGVGEKSACKLVQQWGTVENILANVQSIKGKQGEKIAASAELLDLSKRLTTISLDVPIELDSLSLTLCEPKYDVLNQLFEQMNFKALQRELHTFGRATAPVVETIAAPQPVSDGTQFDLFGAPIVTSYVSTVNEVAQEVVAAPAMQTIETTPHKYTVVESADQLREVVARYMKCEEFCVDTETSGLDPFSDTLVGISLCMKPFEAEYIPLNYADDRAAWLEILRPLLESESIDKVGQNLKFDIMMLRRAGIELGGQLYDTMLIHYLLDAESRHGMNYLAERYLNYSPVAIETLIGKGAKQLTMDRVALPQIAEYAAEDADITLQLKLKLWAELKQVSRLEQLYFSVEEPLIRVLVDIEMAGVNIDSQALAEYSKVLTERLESLASAIREAADEPALNVNSARQIGEVLFGKLKITDKPKMTKTKQYSTDEEYLQSFAGQHPIVDDILEYRGVKKLVSTYVDALPELVNKHTGRLHTSYNQAVTATGRLSSTNPNLQNIPIRDALGKPIRAAFIPADSDHVIISADYSQVELRLMAHLSGDEALLEAFRNGEDVHSATAALLYHKDIQEVSSEERRRAKTANFGIIYGISAFGLSQRLEIPRGEAKQIIDGYFESYPKVREYMDRVVAQAQESGFVETIFGRRRYLRDITSRNSVVRSLAERNAVNAPIQGSAADIMKLAMIGIWRELRAEGLQSKMIMQVHDEVVVDTFRSETEKVKQIVREQMERAAQLSLTLTAECGEGENWLVAH